MLRYVGVCAGVGTSVNEIHDSLSINVVKQRYLSLARSIDSYKNKLLREWCIQVNSISRDCLRQSILVRPDDGGSVSPSTSSLRTASETQSIRQIQSHKMKESKISFENMTIIQNNIGKGSKMPHLNSNFPDDVFFIVEESICLQQMGYKIPETALHLCSQADNYHRYDPFLINKPIESFTKLLILTFLRSFET